jgi:polyisoprenoid-binding protein YceI
MTDAAPQPASTPPTPAPARNRTWWYLGGAVVLVLALVGAGIWYFVFRDDSPEAVSIDRASESVTTRASGAGAGGATGQGSLDGTWSVDRTIGSFGDFTSSFVGYRVQEELAGIGAKTAVGRTPDVEGSMTIDGKTVAKASFTADLSTLKSDQDRRDNAIRGQAIETARFPTTTFTLTKPITLPSVPAEGRTVSVDATGDLTLHGVTRPVTIPLEAVRKGDTIAVTGQVDIPFADFQIAKPTSFAVLSIDDHGILEVQLFFTRRA